METNLSRGKFKNIFVPNVDIFILKAYHRSIFDLMINKKLDSLDLSITLLIHHGQHCKLLINFVSFADIEVSNYWNGWLNTVHKTSLPSHNLHLNEFQTKILSSLKI